MIFPYLPVRMAGPVPSLAGSTVRHRPIYAILLSGPGGSWSRDGLFDTGADDTVFEEWVAGVIGVDLTNAPQRPVGLIGRPAPVLCRYAPTQLRLSDGTETYEWTAVVAFTATRLRYSLFGHAGFLQFFDTDFRGSDRRVILTPNPSFPGRRI